MNFSSVYIRIVNRVLGKNAGFMLLCATPGPGIVTDLSKDCWKIQIALKQQGTQKWRRRNERFKQHPILSGRAGSPDFRKGYSGDRYKALKEKGDNPVNQIVGYIMSGDPTYITSYNGARSLVMKVERDELVEELLKAYITHNSWE